MKALIKLKNWVVNNEYGQFMFWLITFSLTIGCLASLTQVAPVLALIGWAAFLANQWAILNWMKK